MGDRDSKALTIEEFDNIIEDKLYTYELINGVVCMTPRPSFNHQAIMGNLYYIFTHSLKDRPCRALTEVELEIKGDVVVPDISVFCNLDNFNIQRSKQPPIVVIEILSPSNLAMEMEYKRQLYKEHGIKEFLIVNPKTNSITQYDLIKDTVISYSYPNKVKIIYFDGIIINLNDVFNFL